MDFSCQPKDWILKGGIAAGTSMYTMPWWGVHTMQWCTNYRQGSHVHDGHRYTRKLKIYTWTRRPRTESDKTCKVDPCQCGKELEIWMTFKTSTFTLTKWAILWEVLQSDNKYKRWCSVQSNVFRYCSWWRTFCWLVSRISPAKNISSTTA